MSSPSWCPAALHAPFCPIEHALKIKQRPFISTPCLPCVHVPWQSVVQKALTNAMMPTVNMMAVMGLVSIPGMVRVLGTEDETFSLPPNL
eukprot:scaffold13654_cov18-Tisochrysis_lutea.AAC.1